MRRAVLMPRVSRRVTRLICNQQEAVDRIALLRLNGKEEISERNQSTAATIIKKIIKRTDATTSKVSNIKSVAVKLLGA